MGSKFWDLRRDYLTDLIYILFPLYSSHAPPQVAMPSLLPSCFPHLLPIKRLLKRTESKHGFQVAVSSLGEQVLPGQTVEPQLHVQLPSTPHTYACMSTYVVRGELVAISFLLQSCGCRDQAQVIMQTSVYPMSYLSGSSSLIVTAKVTQLIPKPS